MTEMARAHVLISGRVQGVGFRYDTRRVAQGLAVRGWVRNRADGTVEAVIEGEPERVEQMVAWCRGGSALSRVDAVEVSRGGYTGEFADFSIRL
jgi:acylphosphatase